MLLAIELFFCHFVGFSFSMEKNGFFGTFKISFSFRSQLTYQLYVCCLLLWNLMWDYSILVMFYYFPVQFSSYWWKKCLSNLLPVFVNNNSKFMNFYQKSVWYASILCLQYQFFVVVVLFFIDYDDQQTSKITAKISVSFIFDDN